MFPNPFDNPQGGHDQDNTGMVPEAQRVLQGLLAELPDKAHSLVAKVNHEIAKGKEQAETEVANLRDRMQQQVTEVENRADSRRRALLEHAIDQLEPLQKELFRTGDFGKALATFVQIQTLRARLDHVLPDPGNLVNFQQIGRTVHFRVVGRSQGALWGTDAYTSDSFLATAAVHAGALEDGEEGVVRVTMVDMAGTPIRGSFRNGVTSWDWGAYRVGYRVARA